MYHLAVLDYINKMLELNLSGLMCPLPILKTKKFLANFDSGTQIKVITTDPAAELDLQDFCNKTGNILISQEEIEQQLISIIQRR